jgi:hypothetical protein
LHLEIIKTPSAYERNAEIPRYAAAAFKWEEFPILQQLLSQKGWIISIKHPLQTEQV